MEVNQQKNNPQVHSIFRVVLMNVNIQLGSLNIGYVLTYLTLTIDTLFANLGIDSNEKTSKLSIINGILPLGCFVGVIIGFYLKKVFTNKQCIHIADCIGLLSLLATISDTQVVIAFRFFLGVANGISSLIMPVYVKSICPEQYYGQISMIMGYGVNTGLAIGQLMGIGYINYHGESSNWWRVVFLFPSIIFIIRSSVIFFIFNYDSPEQLIKNGKIDKAKEVLCNIYKIEYVEQQFERYQKIVNIQANQQTRFLDQFTGKKFIYLQIGVTAMLVQIWCGAFAVFYYSAQIFEQLSGGDITIKTIYTFCIGLFSSASQFLTIILLPKVGSKYLLIIGSFLMGMINIVIAILSPFNNQQVLFGVFILLVLLIMVFSVTLSPVCFSIVAQLNDSNGTFLSMDFRWAFQAILIFAFPYMANTIQISGSFYLFGALDICYMFYAMLCLVDGRGKTHDELLQSYQDRYQKFQVLPSVER